MFYDVRRTMTEFGKRTFSAAGHALWNSQPASL